MVTYNLPVCTLGNRRLIDIFTESQGGIDCLFYWTTDRRGDFLNSGPLSFIGIKNLIKLNFENGV